VPLPLDYRRVLGVVDYDGHADVIRSCLGRYPSHVVDEWLTEFEARRLIESISATEVDLSRAASATDAPPLEPEDRDALEREVAFADISLSRLGVYLAYDRIAHRPASAKRAKDTVALVVEDDPDQLALAVKRLKDAGYPVRTAGDVRTLYQCLQERAPDAIFLDIGLPDGNGFDVLTSLRRQPSRTNLPIILLTARGEPADVAKGLALGADGYITKPYGRNSLDYLLRYVMKQGI
jgi:CheY-like chemotaxis protein